MTDADHGYESSGRGSPSLLSAMKDLASMPDSSEMVQ
jgi:hypothetical protein